MPPKRKNGQKGTSTKKPKASTLDKARNRSKSKMETIVYINRRKNKSIPSELNIPDNGISYWNEYIFNDKNLIEYAALESQKMSEKNP